jgi:glutamine synthetase
MVPNCARAEDVIKTIKDENVQMIDLRFTDLPGVWQHFSVPPSAVNIDALNEGIGFDSSSTGLDGINNRIDPGRPIDKNLYDLPPAEAKEVKSTPGSLDQALDALERDHAFLLRGDVFTRDVIETWLDYKRKRRSMPLGCAPIPTSSISITTSSSDCSGEGLPLQEASGLREQSSLRGWTGMWV